jgi:hypothetical protein
VNLLAHDTAARRALAAPAFSHDVFQALGRSLRAAWSVLEGLGRARARGQLLQLAREVQASRPELAAQLRRSAARGWV